jgi:acetate---CoA ligase (ADP-forming)
MSVALEAFFRPRSIAIVGASADPDRIGGLPVRFLRSAGFQGRVYPVNPQRREVQGLPAFPSLRDLPEVPELIVVAVPGEQAVSTVRVGADLGSRAAIVFSAGFAEVGDEGARLQADLAAAASSAGMRVLGPNCAGAADFHSGCLATFAPLLRAPQPRPGNVALITQSGAFANYGYAVGRRRGILFSRFLSTGNQADVEVAEGIESAVSDDGTDVVLVYMEGCRDGQRLVCAFGAAQAVGKPVVVVKVGRTGAGQAAVRSHTAALAGSDAIFDAVFRRHGVYRAGSIEELFDIGYACGAGQRPRDRSVALVSVSGGVGVLMADEAEARGLQVASVPEQAQAEIRALVPFAATANPIDVTAQTVNDISLFDRSLQALLRSGGFASVVCFLGFMGQSPEFIARLLPLWRELRRLHPEVLLPIVSLFEPETRDQLAAEPGLMVFEEPTHALRAIAALCRFGEGGSAVVSGADALPPVDPVPRTSRAGLLDEAESLSLISMLGIPTVPFRVARTADEAAAHATELGGFVAVKVLSGDVPHKAKLDGVRLGLTSAEAVRSAFAAVTDAAARALPHARLDGAIVAAMVGPLVEAVIGLQRDVTFGPVVMVGTGGVDVETHRDVAFRVAPLTVAEARSAVGEVSGLRSLDERAREAIALAMVRLAAWAEAEPFLVSADINPLAVTADGAVCALDALVVMAD